VASLDGFQAMGKSLPVKNSRKGMRSPTCTSSSACSRRHLTACWRVVAISYIHASERMYGRDSVAFGRDLHSMVWFTIGTLRELALAIRDARSALAMRRMLDAQSPPWVKLREVEKRWEDDEFFRGMRDTTAFHMDPDVIDKGLSELERQAGAAARRGPLSRRRAKVGDQLNHSRA
jgi:hypothetical protein